MPWCNPYLGSKRAQQDLFDNLAARYPEWCSREVVGYTVMGKPIVMYRVGDPLGAKYLFDGAIHGNSDVSTMTHYYYLRWLLESGDPRAIGILEMRCLLMVPILNVDNCVRKNANGVDLNRNFPYNWSSAGSTDPASDYYRGPSPASEPETQAMINLFEMEKPRVYCNWHNFGGPWCASRNYTSAQRTMNDQLGALYQSLATQMGVEPYRYSSQSLLAGCSSSQAAYMGINSFIIETVDMSGNVYPNYNKAPTLEMVEDYYWPRAKPFHIILSESWTGTLRRINVTSDPSGVPFEVDR